MIERWINAEGFAQIRQDPRFIGICQLARTINAIRELDESARGAGDNNRRRYVCYTMTLALMHEAINNLCPTLRRNWRTSTAYRSGFGDLLSSGDVKDFQARYLKALRNKAVFHNDRDLIQTGLATFDPGVAFSFGSSRLGTTKDAFFMGPELLVLRAVFSGADTVEGFSREFGKATTDLINLVGRFLEAADLLLMHALDVFGFEAREVEE